MSNPTDYGFLFPSFLSSSFPSLSIPPSLLFYFLPFLNLVPPTIKSSGLSERAVVKYKPIALQCIANGIPNPSLTWLKDGQPVSTAQGNFKVSRDVSEPQMRKLQRSSRSSTCLFPNCRFSCHTDVAENLLKQYVFFLAFFRAFNLIFSYEEWNSFKTNKLNSHISF